MSNVTTQAIKFTNSVKAATGTMYVKTGALTDAQIEKGIYLSLNAGEAIEGILKDVSTDAKYGKPQYTIETFDGRTLVVSGSGNLPARMSALNVSIGDPVQLNYNGKVPMKSGAFKGTPAHNWRVEVAE
jgi:hypothetical protein